MKTISFAITTHNEGVCINSLLKSLEELKGKDDEIIVLDDQSTDITTLQILHTHEESGLIKLHNHALNMDFAEHKNYLNALCTKDYIFQLDADEMLNTQLKKALYWLIEQQVDLFWIPRINVVQGLTLQDAIKWNWYVNYKGYIMWPDYQGRLYLNDPNIKWINKVHERIDGHKTETVLPAEPEWAIIHVKYIDKQRQQNNFYETII